MIFRLEVRMKKLLFLAIVVLFSATACKRCETCYLVRTESTGTTETNVGEYCGVERDALLNETLVCLNGTCHYECR